MKKQAGKPTVKWACPECGAEANEHGEGNCANGVGDTCGGFLCECTDEGTNGHGESFDNPCPEANCYHCNWGGVFPQKPKGLQAWEKKALDAGWSPPAKRCAELGIKTKQQGA